MSLSRTVLSAVLLSQPLITIESMELARFLLPVHLCCSLFMAWFNVLRLTFLASFA